MGIDNEDLESGVADWKVPENKSPAEEAIEESTKKETPVEEGRKNISTTETTEQAKKEVEVQLDILSESIKRAEGQIQEIQKSLEQGQTNYRGNDVRNIISQVVNGIESVRQQLVDFKRKTGWDVSLAIEKINDMATIFKEAEGIGAAKGDNLVDENDVRGLVGKLYVLNQVETYVRSTFSESIDK